MGGALQPVVGDSALICSWTTVTAHLIYELIKLLLLTRDQDLHTNLVPGELKALVGVCMAGILKIPAYLTQ